MSFFNMAFTNKVALTSAVVNVLMLVLLPVHQIEGFSSGAPDRVCDTMTPGHETPAQTSPSPFETVISDKSTNKSAMLELGPSSSAVVKSFKGYLVIAYDVKDDSKPIGTFKVQNGGKLLNCGGSRENAVTHGGNNEKNSVSIEWIPPPNYSGQVIFRTTFVQNKATFWVKTESKPVTFMTVVPSKSGSVGVSIIYANLVFLSLLVFLV